MVSSATGFRHVNVGDLVKANQLHCGFDEEFDSFLLDEDKVRTSTVTGSREGCCGAPCRRRCDAGKESALYMRPGAGPPPQQPSSWAQRGLCGGGARHCTAALRSNPAAASGARVRSLGAPLTRRGPRRPAPRRHARPSLTRPAAQVCDYLEDLMVEGGLVVDHHSCDFFPKRWFDLVVVLQTDNTLLYDRLAKRGYSAKKIAENVECEIMHVVVEEAAEAYDAEVVQVLPSNDLDEVEGNVDRIVEWARLFCVAHTPTA